MVKRNIAITLDKAIELFNSNDESIKEIVLQAFSKEELMHDFRKITTFKKACEALNLTYYLLFTRINIIYKKCRTLNCNWIIRKTNKRPFCIFCKMQILT